MKYVTHNNHWQFGWGDDLFNFNSKQGNYWVKFGRAEYIPRSFRNECVRAARLIYENAELPILICYSGGIDSEIIVKSFEEAKVPFEVVISKWNYLDEINMNHHDNKHAFSYVKRNNIKHHIVEIDFEKFVLEKYKDEADKFMGPYPGVYLHTEITKLFPNHHCVLGGGNVFLYRYRFDAKLQNKPGLYLSEIQRSIGAVEEAYKINNGISNRFFMHTPELMLAYLIDPDVYHWIKYESSLISRWTLINCHGIKAFMSYRNWPDMTPRPKYHGFEKCSLFEDPENTKHNQLVKNIFLGVAEKYKNRNENDIKIDLNDLLKMLWPIEENYYTFFNRELWT